MLLFTQYRIAATNTFWLLWHSLRILPFQTWFSCWLPLRISKQIVFGNFLFSLRGKRLRDTIVDLYMALLCFHDEQYNPPPDFILREGDTVIDIGGHIGSFALYAASRVGSRGNVYVYEPASDNNTHLRHNVAQSGFLNVRVEAAAIAGSRGVRRFVYDPVNTAMHGLYQRNTNSIDVPAITLADIFFEHRIDRCNFLKIDCEGAEYEILYNTPRAILERVDRIAMEYHNPPFYGLNDREHNPDQLAAFLRDAGFSVRMAPENRMHGLLFASRIRR